MEHALLNKKKDLEAYGYKKFGLMTLPVPSLEADLRELAEEFDHLPRDTYSPESHRYRKYSRAIINPWDGALQWLPDFIDEDGEAKSLYFQGTFNAEYLEEYRAFPALSEKIKENALLQEIIKYDFNETFWNPYEKILPIHVGVHFVKYMVEDETQESVASPNTIHQDGEPFTFVHLITYKNVHGGRSTVAHPSCAGLNREQANEKLILDEFDLTEPLDSYGVCDKKVSHYVSGIKKGPESRPAERGVLLIDYTPLTIAIT
ncbi:2OG-Fe dioxygenase family protein [Bacillus massilinigeriensis]|uniref:2OG-Fe dioxygenase family protein n=1 Tax=Bacillus mediterraneensis TaxID=1805474 RepID=UPI0009F4AEFC|nr:2OG-Fe dioxygenase family protein [Bacillus mediterraneensis]